MKFESKNLQVNSKNLHYLKSGNGNPILLVHGWGGSSNSLLELGKLLSQKYEVYIIDLPGFGDSELPEAGWGVEEFSNIIKDFASQLGLEKFYYFGHSFGGAIGIYLSANYPDLFSKLILCAPSFKRSSKSKPQKSTIKSKLKSGIRNTFPKLVRLFYKIRYPGSESMKYPELESNFRKIITQDLTDELGNITVKTLIIWGTEDSYTPFENSRILNKGIQNSELKIMKNLGHGIPLTNYKEIYAMIDNFLSKN